MEMEEESELNKELETLRNENDQLKQTQNASQEETNKLQDELEEMKAKVRILEEGSFTGGELSQEDVAALTEENEAEILEVKTLIFHSINFFFS